MALTFTNSEFDQVLRHAQDFYHGLKIVHCPFFHDKIHFTPEGLQHLRRKSWNRGRSRDDQFMRLKHIAVVPRILQLSHTLQGIWHGHERVRQHRHGRWEEAFVPATFFEFVAVTNAVHQSAFVGRSAPRLRKRLPYGRPVSHQHIPNARLVILPGRNIPVRKQTAGRLGKTLNETIPKGQRRGLRRA